MTILDTCILQGNTASIAGGGIEHVNTTGSTLDVVNSTICTNVPEDITGPWTDLGSNTVCLSCVGDIVPDGIINGEDLSVLLGDWGKCPPKATCAGDLNDDSVVNGADLSILLANWGPCN